LIFFPQQTIEAWSIVFYMASAIYFGLNTIFLIFASSTVQPWNTYWESQQQQQQQQHEKKTEEKKP